MICVSLKADKTDEALSLMERAFTVAPMVELRLDGIAGLELERLLAAASGPVIVTNRSRREGGSFEGSEEERCSIIAKAMDLGADYVDVEMSSDPRLLEELAGRASTGGVNPRLILSFHDFEKTPPEEVLLEIVDQAFDRGAHMAKIAVMAAAIEDNLTVLNLLKKNLAKNRPLTAFCMGERGRLSRLTAPLFGSLITYAALEKGMESGPGQFTVDELRKWQELFK